MNTLLRSLFCTNHFRQFVPFPEHFCFFLVDRLSIKSLRKVNVQQRASRLRCDACSTTYIVSYRPTLMSQILTPTIPSGTTESTKSFGWSDSVLQHDVPEFNRVLQDKIEFLMMGCRFLPPFGQRSAMLRDVMVKVPLRHIVNVFLTLLQRFTIASSKLTSVNSSTRLPTGQNPGDTGFTPFSCTSSDLHGGHYSHSSHCMLIG